MRQRVLVSLTTTPLRIAHLEPTLISLQAACAALRAHTDGAVDVDICVSVPRGDALRGAAVGGSYDEQIIPLWLSPFVQRVARDLGPIVKLLGGLEWRGPQGSGLGPDDILVTVDDDVTYPRSLLVALLDACLAEPCAAHGAAAMSQGMAPCVAHGEMAQTLEGFGGVAYRRRFFPGACDDGGDASHGSQDGDDDDDNGVAGGGASGGGGGATSFAKFVAQVHAACPAAILADDVVISTYLRRVRGVALRNVRVPTLRRAMVLCHDARRDVGAGPDALSHTGRGGHAKRYRIVAKAMEAFLPRSSEGASAVCKCTPPLPAGSHGALTAAAPVMTVNRRLSCPVGHTSFSWGQASNTSASPSMAPAGHTRFSFGAGWRLPTVPAVPTPPVIATAALHLHRVRDACLSLIRDLEVELGLVTIASHQRPSEPQSKKLPAEKSNAVDAAPETDLCAMEPSVMRRPPKWQHESRIRACIQDAVRTVDAAAADALTRDAQLRVRGTIMLSRKLAHDLSSAGGIDTPTTAEKLALYMVRDELRLKSPVPAAFVADASSARAILHEYFHDTLSEHSIRRVLAAAFNPPPACAHAALHGPARVAAEGSVPLWLAEVWCAAMGEQDALALAAATNEPPSTCLRASPLAAGASVSPSAALVRALAAEGVLTEPCELSPQGVRLRPTPGQPGVNLRSLLAWRRRLFEVQDEGSQLIALAAAGTSGRALGWVVLDLCAGRGGKTMALLESVGPGGAVVAHDVNLEALQVLDSRARRAQSVPGGAKAKAKAKERGEGSERGTLLIEREKGKLRDAIRSMRGKVGGSDGSGSSGIGDDGDGADAVLVDAPCSSFGTLRRGPLQRWHLLGTAEPPASRVRQFLGSFPPLQTALLREGATHVRVGGVLVYATCTTHTAENEDVAARFEAEHRGTFTRAPLAEAWGTDVATKAGLGNATGGSAGEGEHAITLLPHVHHTDGYFIARWRRIA